MNVLIFGGTTEAGRLARTLWKNGHTVTLSVATSYGEEISRNDNEFEILVGRTDGPEMISLLENRDFDVVVDATHPFADLATRNVRRACEATKTEYRRLLRSKSDRRAEVVYVRSADEAVEILRRESGNVFLAIGSKELEPFTRLDRFASRCHVRILPMPESLCKALELGFQSPRIVCMQGPFSTNLNRAMLEASGAKFLVTKDSGEAGGVEEKIDAALQCGCRTIVLERPVEETGSSFEELCDYFQASSGDECRADGYFPFFPLFFSLKGKRILVVGGGRVARRRVGILRRFGADIRLVSPALTEELRDMADRNELSFEKREYETGDVERARPFLAIAATDCRKTNEAVAEEAGKLGVPTIVSDCRERCDCYFPALAENDLFLCGIVSKNGDHAGVRDVARRIRRLFNETETP